MSIRRSLVFAIALGFLCLTRAQGHDSRSTTEANTSSGPFLVEPYLQLGYSPARGTVRLLWHTADVDADWSVEYRAGTDRPWTKLGAPSSRRIGVEGVEPHRVYGATIVGLEPGTPFGYQVKKGGEVVFASESVAPKSASQPYRFVVFGDCGAGTPEQAPVAAQAMAARPDLLVIPGDIVYSRGRASEYRKFFWPIYNVSSAGSTGGVPLLRLTIAAASPGNHDTDTTDIDRFPDALAYYYYWEQPLNGPRGDEGSALLPKVTASEEHRRAFEAAAGQAYRRMANFSFDYGNTHWTMLDSNTYVDWTDKALRDWIAADLAAAQNATWRFVVFHHPGFNSSREHYEQQHMRLLSPLFEQGKVDIVWSGHVHNYQRSYPLRFKPDNSGTLLVGRDKQAVRGRVVNGQWKLDKSFDGRGDTTPDGIIYVVTGAGGQHLYNPEQQDDRDSWQGFTDKFISKTHSLTVAEIEGKTLNVRQLAADGREVDRFTVTK